MPLYRQPKSPHWWIRFSVGGIKTRCSSGTADKAAAEELEARLRSDRWREYRLGERPRYSWKEAVERWYEGAEGRDKERDHERLKWFGAELDELALADITPEIIEKLRKLRAAEAAKKYGRGDGKATANRYMAQLRLILHLARDEWDWLGKCPKVPMYKIGKREPRFMTRAQARALLRELSGLPHLQLLAEFELETGLRMRNATRLTWQQVDLRRRQLVIPAARAKGKDTIPIPLSARAVAILKAQRGHHAEHVFTFKRGPKGRALPFDDANGAAFKAAARRAGVPWLRWHDLRHTWASWHVQSGTPLQVLKELGGWRTMESVMVYAHLSVEHLKRFAEHKKGIPRRT
jgi:integrase